MRDTRRKLIDTAFELFGRNGFHAIGLDAILDAVGVSKQTFYNHFECKEDLILAVLRATPDRAWSIPGRSRPATRGQRIATRA
jgi:AcrR family transcriptional regulator